MRTYDEQMHRIFQTPVSAVYPHYLAKVIKKNRTKAELDEIICWLTSMNESQLQKALADNQTFAEFFEQANLTANAHLITGVICGVRIQEIEDPLMKQIRYLDKLVDELAKGKPLEKIKRQG